MPVPVALFAYKRPDHVAATLDALARNTLAVQTELIVFSDGPKGEADTASVNAVRDVVRAITGFSRVTLVERPSNMGLARSVITGVSELLAQHDRIIVLEDDLITSRYFLEYMNNVLEHYRNDPKVFSVTGHTFPASHFVIPQNYAFDTYAGYRCSSWSWGIWRDRWQRVDWEMSYFPAFKCDTAAQEKFNRGGQDMTEMLRLQYEGKIDSWAIRFCYAHHAHDMRCIYPTRTMVKNIGLDHSGTHSKPDPRFFHPALDENWRPQQLCPANEMDDDIVRRYRAIFNPPIPFEGRRLLGKVKGRLRPWARLVRELAARAKRVLLRPIQDVDILIVNTYQKNGGAARAAWRTYCGIRTKYPGAAYLTLFRDDWSPGVIGLFNTSVRGAIAQRLVRLDQRPLNAYPDRLSVFFSPAVYPNPLRVPLTRYRPKLAHLHWVGHGLLSVEEIGRLRCPIVWTLHDTWAFTGGCHYTSDCVGFKKECGHCPQLGSSDDEDLSRMLMRRKAKAFRDLNLTIVTPSQWLAKLAERSSLFAGRRIEVIPNGLDTNAFAPVSRTAARAYLRLPDELPVILFGAHWLLDPRKGSDLLCEALSILAKKCTLLTFGEGQLQLSSSHNVRSIPLGNLTDAASLALAYSAADVFVCPSREDNLPNTVAEALACGTPCVAFDVNGLPDMITHKVNGWLASPFDPSALADGILWILSHPNPEQLSRAARAKAVAEYSLDVMSSRYGALYSELLAGGRQ